jgi:Putative Zn-dependent protease, contains TPR repeats
METNDDNQWEDEEMIKEAVSRFEAMLSSHSTSYFDAEEFEWIIDYYMQNDDLKKSREAVDIAIAQHPENNNLKIKNARQFLIENNPRKALSLLDNTEIDYDEPDYFLTLGSCYAAIGKSQKAIDTYTNALSYFEECERVELYNAIAFEYQNLRDYKTALDYFKKTLKYTDELDNQYLEIRHCYHFMDNMEAAIQFFKLRIEENPHDRSAWSALGDCYRKLDLLEQAIDSYEYVLAIEPNNLWANMHIANAYYDLERYNEAIDTLKEALNNNVETSLIHCLLGDCYSRIENANNALIHYNKALKINEYLPEAWAGIGFIYSDQNKSEIAIKYFEKAHRLEPSNSDHLYVLASEYRKIDDFDKAMQCLLQVEDMEPEDEDLYFFLADLLTAQGKYDEVEETLKLGLKRTDNAPSLSYYLAYIYLLKGEKEMGLSILDIALSADFEGHKDFIELNPEMLNNDIEVLELINLYKQKQ